MIRRLTALFLAVLLTLSMALPSDAARRGWSTSNFLRYAVGVVTAVPLSMCVWAKTSVTGSAQTIMGLFTSGSAFNRNSFRLSLSSGDNVSFNTADGSTSNNAATSTTIIANTWFHACGVTSAANSRAGYLNGGGKGTNTTSTTPTGINRTSVGVGDGSSAVAEFAPAGTGDIAWATIWNVALSDADIAVLATGVDPRLIHPEAIVGFWPLDAGYSPENNLYDATSVLSVQGSLSTVSGPPLYRAY